MRDRTHIFFCRNIISIVAAAVYLLGGIFLIDKASANILFSKSEGKEVFIDLLDGTKQKGSLLQIVKTPADALANTPEKTNFLVKINNRDWLIPINTFLRVSMFQKETLTYKSGTSTECFSLGKDIREVPEPANWYLRLENSEYWQDAVAAHPSASWYYIPGAMWIWGSKNLEQINGETVLFRTPIEIPPNFNITDATLTVTADSQVDSIYLNGVQICGEKKKLIGRKIKYDVSLLAENGLNILALKASNPYESDINFAGIAFSLSVEGYYGGALPVNSRAKNPAYPVIVQLLNGDVIKGDIEGIESQKISVKTSYGKIAIDTDWIKEVNFAQEEEKESSSSQNDKGFYRDSDDEAGRFFFHEIPSKNPYDKEGILLHDGAFIQGKAIKLSKYKVMIKPPLTRESEIELYKIRSIYPNATVDKEPSLYDLSGDIIPARFTFSNGDKITALIEDAGDGKIKFSAPYSNSMSISLDGIFNFDFPLNPILIEKDKLKGKKLNVGFMGELRKRTKNTEEGAYYKTDSILQMLGVASEFINPTQMPYKDYFSPSKFSLIFNVDEFEQYYHTIKTNEDGYDALFRYVKSGGNLAHIAPGAPFVYPSAANRNRWGRINSQTNLNADLNMQIVVPGEESGNTLKTIELPENSGAELYFELSKDTLPPQLDFLPEKVSFPETKDTKFRPVAPVNLTNKQSFYPVYILKDDLGKTYGPAFAIVFYKDETNNLKNFTSYCSSVLLNAEYEHIPMLNFLIPQFISLAASGK